MALPASSDPVNPANIVLSFDYSDNSAPASVSNGQFKVIVDVVPGSVSGILRMFAVAPADKNDSNLVCRFQAISQSQVECSFKFPDNGVWAIHAQYEVAPQTDVAAVAVTNLRVTN